MKKKERTRDIHFRLTERELSALKDKADKAGLSLTAFILRQALGKSVKAKTDIQLVFQLQKIGNNINQITKLLHYDALNYSPGINKKLLEDLQIALEKLGKISSNDSEN
jgi:uncharacterized protein (DUF1778 family)